MAWDRSLAASRRRLPADDGALRVEPPGDRRAAPRSTPVGGEAEGGGGRSGTLRPRSARATNCHPPPSPASRSGRTSPRPIKPRMSREESGRIGGGRGSLVALLAALAPVLLVGI